MDSPKLNQKIILIICGSSRKNSTLIHTLSKVTD